MAQLFRILIMLLRFVPVRLFRVGSLQRGFWKWVADNIVPHIDATVYIEEQLGWLTKPYIDHRIRELLHRSELRAYQSFFITPMLNHEHVIAEILGVGHFSMKIDVAGLKGTRILLNLYGRTMSADNTLVWRLSNSYPIERRDDSQPELIDIPEEYYHNGVRAVLVQVQGIAKPLYYEWFWR